LRWGEKEKEREVGGKVMHGHGFEIGESETGRK